MKFTIYKTINDINGKFYIGKHQTENIDDDYLGSGIALQKAIKKYGREHFHKEILFIFDTEEEMNQKERELVTEKIIQNNQCYNMMVGGEGGDNWTGKHHSNDTKQHIREKMNETVNTTDFKHKVSKAVKNAYANLRIQNPDKFYSDIEKRENAVREKFRKNRESGIYNGKSFQLSDETKQKISNAIKHHYDIVGRKNQKREIKTDKKLSGKKTMITDGNKEIMIFIEELPWYLENGWKVGHSPNRKSMVLTEEGKRSSSGKGKIIVHNLELQQVKRIEPNELNTYLLLGWKRGYLNPKKRK